MIGWKNSGVVCMICGNAPAVLIRRKAPLSAEEIRMLSRVLKDTGVKLLCRECYEQGRCGDLRFIPVKRKKGDKNGNVQECGMQEN